MDGPALSLSTHPPLHSGSSTYTYLLSVCSRDLTQVCSLLFFLGGFVLFNNLNLANLTHNISFPLPHLLVSISSYCEVSILLKFMLYNNIKTNFDKLGNFKTQFELFKLDYLNDSFML